MRPSLNRQTAPRYVRVVFARAVKDLLRSEVRRKAITLLVLLLLFALSVNGLNVVNSYVGRNFMTAIAQRDMAGFLCQGRPRGPCLTTGFMSSTLLYDPRPGKAG
jgi:ABC-type uncharacterized transport system fused permease/ATPase subunit